MPTASCLRRLGSILFLVYPTVLPAQAEKLLSGIPREIDRIWVGPDFWANRLQDWRLHAGRLECIESRPGFPMRTAYLLTRNLKGGEGGIELSVRLGLIEPGGSVSPEAAAGFLLGIGRGEMDWRAAALVHHSSGPGAGLFAGITADGTVFIRDNEKPGAQPIAAGGKGEAPRDTVLRLRAQVPPGGRARVVLERVDPESGEALSALRGEIAAPRLAGGLALVSHPGRRAGGRETGRFWFRDFELTGSKVARHPERALGPILSLQYTVSRGVLKLAAQLFPVGGGDSGKALLEVHENGAWRRIAEAEVIVPGWTATFRVAPWDTAQDRRVRVTYGDSSYEGIVRRDPVEKPVLVVAGFTGNHNCRAGAERPGYDWIHGMWFPHQDLVDRVAFHRPDLLFFSGDQVYEGGSPTRPDRQRLELDYLYKWYLWCWAYRELTRSTPCVTIPDDHDVYQGNLWGEGGRPTDKDDKGGYVRPASFVKMVERTQTSHLPDPVDPRPIEQGIGVYFTHLVYGRVSFAILEDRKFKSGCNGRVVHNGPRADHITDPSFDVRKADLPGLKLLGDRQLAFLRRWAEDWKGADMKAALSQTHFANLATHHGPNLVYLRADLDSNGWPQSGRKRALRALRRAFAFHLCGDQHLATVVHHGIDTWGDAIWAFAVPSIANFYPRMWKPPHPGRHRAPGAPEYTGEFLDGLGNYVTVYAATNPGRKTGREPAALHDRMPGYGIVRFNKLERTITIECWPRYADPAKDAQYEGWPITIHQLSNYARKPLAHLPELEISAPEDPVVHVRDGETGELLYAVRIRGRRFRPPVFRWSRYTVVVELPERGLRRVLEGIEPLDVWVRKTLPVRLAP